MKDKIQEINKKLEQTEDDEITISLLYQKTELLEDLIDEYEVNMNCGRENQNTLRETIKTLQKDIKKKEQLEKEVADDIDKVAVELSKLSDNIYIVNQAMLLQKIAQEKLGKFYID